MSENNRIHRETVKHPASTTDVTFEETFQKISASAPKLHCQSCSTTIYTLYIHNDPLVIKQIPLANTHSGFEEVKETTPNDTQQSVGRDYLL